MSRRCTSEPLSRWSCPDLATEAVAQGITTAISASTIRRILADDAIKPWQYRSWLLGRHDEAQALAARAQEIKEQNENGAAS